MRITLKKKPKSLWIEAEEGKISSPMVIENEAGLPEKKYIHQPASESRSGRLLGEKGHVEFSVEITERDQYRLWARVYYIDIDGNSWYCHIDDGKPTVLGNELQPLQKWHWIKGNLWNLAPSRHTIHLKTRENGARFDRLLLTSIPDYVIDTVGLSIGKLQTFHKSILMQKNVCYPTDTLSFMVHPPEGYQFLDDNLSIKIKVKDSNGAILSEAEGTINYEFQLNMENEETGQYFIEVTILKNENTATEIVQKDFWVIPTIQELAKIHPDSQLSSCLPTIEEWLQELHSGRLSGETQVSESGRSIHDAIQSFISGTDPFKNKTGWLLKAYLSTLDGSRQPYLLHIPTNYDPKKPYPLSIYMHGVTRGARHFRYMLEDLAGVDADTIKDIILLSVEGRGTLWYDHIAEEDLFSVIEEVKNKYTIDKDRIYLWGESMGGYGSYRLACKYPQMWAAIAPCAGGSIPALLGNLKHLPVNIFHGEKDVIIPVEEAYEAFETLQSLGQEVYLSVIPNGDHQTDETVSQKPDFWKWFLKFKRVKNPLHVVYNTYSLRHNRAYWVTIDAFIDYSQETPSSIEAKITNQHTIEVVTKNIAKFSLNLNALPIDLTHPILINVNGKIEIRTKHSNGKIQVMICDYPETGLFKKHRLSGPFGDQYYDRFIIVYGTKIDKSTNRDAAISYAQWKSWESICDMRHLVRSEEEISIQDISQAHLVVFGTPQTSSLLADVSKHLPIQINEHNISIQSQTFSGNNIAVRLIYPNPLNPEKYLVLFAAPTPQAFKLLPEWQANERQFKNQPELVVYDGIDRPCYSAFFDMNWKLP